MARYVDKNLAKLLCEVGKLRLIKLLSIYLRKSIESLRIVCNNDTVVAVCHCMHLYSLSINEFFGNLIKESLRLAKPLVHSCELYEVTRANDHHRPRAIFESTDVAWGIQVALESDWRVQVTRLLV